MEYNINSIAPSGNIIPEGCTNLYDFGIFANRGIMDSFNEMRFLALESQIFILKEYTGDDVITESMKEKLKEMGRRIKKGFLDMLKNIKEFFARIATFIKNLFTKVKQEVFSKATKEDFNKAVEFFKNYDGEQIKFTIDSDKDNIFFGTKDFIKQTDEFNKEILNKAQYCFNNLNLIYSIADTNTSSGVWLGKKISDKKKAIEMLKTSQAKQIYGYILLDKEYDNGISDSFGKEEVEAAIYKELNDVSFLRTPITSSNLKNFSIRISEAVYGSNIQNKWVGITKDEYDKLKGIIEEAIRWAERFDSYVDDDDESINKQNEWLKNASSKIRQKQGDPEVEFTIGPGFALDYAARCKDILTVVVAVSSVMNNMINDIYHKDVKLVCSIINKYYKASKQKKEVKYDPKYDPTPTPA